MGFTLLCVTDCVFLKFNHFLFKNAFRIKCRLRKTFFSKLDFSRLCVETRVLLGFTPFCVKSYVLPKINNSLKKYAFCMKTRLRKKFLFLIGFYIILC